MPVKRRVAKTRRFSDISADVWTWLRDDVDPPKGTDDWWTVFILKGDELVLHRRRESQLTDLWDQVRDELLAEFIAAHPGTRPRLWWVFDAPEKARKQIGGAGAPAHKVYGYAESYSFGVPNYWARYQSGDPPTFESQAAFLRRHKLLTDAELRQLKAADFAATETLDSSCDVQLGVTS